MEEKSLEEMMLDLTGNIETTPIPDEPVVVDLGNKPLPKMVSVVSQSPYDNAVSEMIEMPTDYFYTKHIDMELSELEKEYVSMKRKEQAINKKIAMIKEENAKVFEEIAKLETLKSSITKDEDDFKNVIARKMFLTGEKKWKGMEVSFTYVAASFKDKFNMDRFKTEQPNIWAKYVEKSPVSEYIRTKLELLPVREDELKYANESIE